jgi:hypothetical protein
LESSRRRNSVTVSGRPDSDHRQQPAGIRLNPAIDPVGSGQNGRDPTGSRRVQPKSGQICSPESDNGDKTLPDSGAICRTLIFAFVIFLSEPNA